MSIYRIITIAVLVVSLASQGTALSFRPDMLRQFVTASSSDRFRGMSQVVYGDHIIQAISNSNLGCSILVCPNSNCSAGIFRRSVGNTGSVEYCHLGPVSQENGLITMLVGFRSSATLVVANISSILTNTSAAISIHGSATLSNAARSRGVVLTADPISGIPIVAAQTASGLSLYRCPTWACVNPTVTNLWNATIYTTLVNMTLLRGASIGAGFGFVLVDANINVLQLWSCKNTSQCASPSIVNLSPNLGLLAGETFSAVTVFHGNGAQLSSNGFLVFYAATNKRIIFIECNSLNCSDFSIRGRYLLPASGSELISSGWTVLGGAPSTILMAVTLGSTTENRGWVRLVYCANLSCVEEAVWTGRSLGSTFITLKSGIPLFSAVASHISGWASWIVPVSICSNNSHVAASFSLGQCVPCPEGAVKLNRTTCVPCDRFSGLGSANGFTCVSCSLASAAGCQSCPFGSRLAENGTCSTCSSGSYSDASTSGACTSCDGLASPDRSVCLSSSPIIPVVNCTTPSGTRDANCVSGSSTGTPGAVCLNGRCVCIEGWRYVNGLCAPPESDACRPRPPSPSSFYAKLQSITRFTSASKEMVEVAIEMPLEAQSDDFEIGFVVNTTIDWVGGSNNCQYPSGRYNTFFSKGVRFPDCREVIAALWPVADIYRTCTVSRALSGVGVNWTYTSDIVVTRTYGLRNFSSGETSVFRRSQGLRLLFSGPSNLISPPQRLMFPPNLSPEASAIAGQSGSPETGLIIAAAIAAAIAIALIAAALILFYRMSKNKPSPAASASVDNAKKEDVPIPVPAESEAPAKEPKKKPRGKKNKNKELVAAPSRGRSASRSRRSSRSRTPSRSPSHSSASSRKLPASASISPSPSRSQSYSRSSKSRSASGSPTRSQSSTDSKSESPSKPRSSSRPHSSSRSPSPSRSRSASPSRSSSSRSRSRSPSSSRSRSPSQSGSASRSSSPSKSGSASRSRSRSLSPSANQNSAENAKASAEDDSGEIAFDE